MKRYALVLVFVVLAVLVGCKEHEHTWKKLDVSTPATCLDAGEDVYECIACGAERVESVPATGVHEYNEEGKCVFCGNEKTKIESAEARIGHVYYDTLTDAIKSLKDAESKTAEINVLAGSVDLDVISSVLPSVNHYSIAIVGKGRENSTLNVLTQNGGSDGSRVHYAENVDLVFKGLKVDFGGNTNYQGFVRSTSLEFDDCSISGMASYWGSGEVVFNNCVFEDNGDYNLWLYSGSKFTFVGCEFNSSVGKFINAYQPGATTSVEVKIDGCKFIGTTEKYAGIFLKPEAAWNVSIVETSSEGVADGSISGSPLYDVRIEGGDGGATVKEETTVTIDGVVVWENGAKKSN